MQIRKLFYRIAVTVMLLPVYDCFAQTAAPACSLTSFEKEITDSNTVLRYKFAEHIKEMLDSNILVTGTANASDVSSVNGASKYGYITKLDRLGNIIWSKQYSNSTVYAGKLAEINDSSLYMLNNTYYKDTFSVSKINKQGNIVWTKKYTNISNGPGSTSVTFSIQATLDGSLLITGYSIYGFSIIKMDAVGGILWSKVIYPEDLVYFGFSVGDIYTDHNQMIEDTSGYIICSPQLNEYINVGNMMYLFKMNKNTGQLLWTKEIGANPLGLIQTDTGFVCLSMSNVAGGLLSVLQFSATANLQNAFSVNNFQRLQSVVYSTDKKLVFAATDTVLQSTAPYVIYQADKYGHIEWAKKYTSTIGSVALQHGRPHLMQSNVPGITGIITRRTNGFSATNCLIKADKTGNAGDCTTTLFDISTKVIFPFVSNISSTVFNSTFYTTSSVLALDNLQTFINPICERATYCDSVKLYGADTICSIRDAVVYRVKRNRNCFTTPVWKVSDQSIASIFAATDSTVKIKFKKSGTVKITAMIPGNCATIADSLQVAVFDRPDTLQLGNDLQLCGNNSFLLHAGSGYKMYRWQNNSTDSVCSVHVPGRYFVTAEDYCGNIFSDTVTALIATPPAIFIGIDTFKCNHDTITISAPGGFIHYAWSPNYSISNTNTAVVKLFPDTSTVYYLSAEKNPGCIAYDTIRIEVYKTAAIQLGNDSSLCAGAEKILNAGSGFSSYVWSTNETTQQIAAVQQKTYWVMASDIHGCYSSDTFSILSVNPNPIIHLIKNKLLCQGENLVLDAGRNFIQYKWYDGSTNQRCTVDTVGKYWVTVTDNNHCQASDTASIKAIVPIPKHFVEPDSSICIASSIVLSAIGSYTAYLWSNGSVSKFISMNTAGNYWLQVTDSNGCQAKEWIHLQAKDCREVIYFPTAFSPNNNNTNDFFRPSVFGKLQQYRLEIYNRYGQMVFATTDWQRGWDGNFNGAKQNIGGYIWQSQYRFFGKFLQQQKGVLVLLR